MSWRHFLAAGLVAAVTPLAAAHAGSWEVGPFTLSDELGGFEILSVTGSGTEDDPAIVTERFLSPEPGTIVIRLDPASRADFVRLSMVIDVDNQSRRAWVGFDLELQEQRHQPSVYTDGLSFDQMHVFADRVFRSDRFGTFSDLSEPYDRVRFEGGSVNHGDRVRMRFFITDVTPKATFYLLQEPQFITANGPGAGGRHHAAGTDLAAEADPLL
jgi:hypothetical protein